jgi:hypothetical protein
MKIIRNMVTLAGLFLVVFGLGATGARAQSMRTTHFTGTFNLPFEAQWGNAILPVGQYSLYYGRLSDAGPAMVEVVGKDTWSPHVLIPVQGIDPASGKKSALVCIREGDAGIVRTLELPQIGEAVSFKLPRHTQLMAYQHNGSANKLLAEAPMLIQRVAVTLNQK